MEEGIVEWDWLQDVDASPVKGLAEQLVWTTRAGLKSSSNSFRGEGDAISYRKGLSREDLTPHHRLVMMASHFDP